MLCCVVSCRGAGPSNYTVSIVGFVVVVLLLVAVVAAIFTACICCGLCKSQRPPSRGQQTSLSTCNHGNARTTKQDSITLPRQPPPSSHSVCSHGHFPLPPSALALTLPALPTTADSTSLSRPSNTSRTTVLHLAQLPSLAIQDRHVLPFTRRSSLPHYSSTPSQAHATPTNNHRHFSYQTSIGPGRTRAFLGRLKVPPGATPDAGGGAGTICKTPRSAGVVPLSLNFPSPLMQQLAHCRANAGHTHTSPNHHFKARHVCEDNEVEMDKEIETDDFSSTSYGDFNQPPATEHTPVRRAPRGVVREVAPPSDSLPLTKIITSV